MAANSSSVLHAGLPASFWSSPAQTPRPSSASALTSLIGVARHAARPLVHDELRGRRGLLGAATGAATTDKGGVLRGYLKKKGVDANAAAA